MTLQFKKTSDDPRKVIKSFENVGEAVPAIPTENCSILSPVWLLAYSSSYEGATHVTCSSLGGRTYFITDIVLSPGGKCYVYGSVDVLATYGALIKERSGTVIRSESIGAPTLIRTESFQSRPTIYKLTLTFLRKRPLTHSQHHINLYLRR